MAGATGIVHYALTSSAPVGQLLGGQWAEDIGVQERGGIGGVGVNVPGQQLSAARVQYLPVDANCLVGSVLRASYPNGAMTAINLEVGDDELGLSGSTWQCNEAVATMEANAALQLDLLVHLPAGKATRTAGAGVHSTCPKTTAEWFRGSAKVGAANAGLRRVQFTIRNNLVPFYSLNEVAAASQRFPEYANKGNEQVSIAAVYLVNHGENLTLDEMQTIGTLIATALTNASPAVTITFTATTPQMHSWSTGPTAHDQLKAIEATLGLDPNNGGMAIAIA